MPENSCQAGWPFQRRWAFNPISGLCEDFIHCTGNSSNNFLSLNACRVQCVLGACCFRQPKQGVHASRQDDDRYGYNISNVDGTLEVYSAESWYSNIELNLTELEGVGEDGRKEHSKAQRERSGSDCSPDFAYTCERLSLTQCQVRVKELPEEAEAVSFSRGRTCSEVSCSQGCGCLSRRHLRKYGERFRQGCEECVCTHGGVDCVCAHLTQRKEIRDLTLRERKMYQRAIRRLRAKPAVWEGFAQMRAEFSPQAGSDAYFLPWHRYFLRLVERELQALSSCQLAVPYFEWTVDAGSMRSSAAWQAGLFGGDGDPGSGCVPQHPFQGWTARSHWSPCLKRSFNSTVWLPDAVTLQMIVNQGDFQLLSQSLQAFSGLFQLWVGGHMASPLAAYDPLYLSHMAFMDKLWTQWQEKHQRMDWVKNTYEYNQGSRDGHTIDSHSPARKRHVKMKPFDVTPDDVRSSRCVVYVPITIGAPCNVTMFEKPPQRSDYTDDHNIQRRHKHYFDKRSGIEGSDFDPNGYDRDGFDRSGWNRRGFGMDGLNRDLIDREGYDVSGFNRYGVNRSNITWFGMRWDGVFESKEEANNSGHRDRDERREVEPDEVMSEIFSDGGYSVYGFDPFGLDRSGFDAFGFRPDGYDKDSCNWFLNGPHYMRFYFHTQQQLMATSTPALKRITRTCPPITSLPQHWATQEWMALDPEQSSALIGRLEHERIEQKWADSDESTTATPRNKWNVWLPITPDHRLCFKLHWFSGCPLGSPPITCPDLCSQARCHGYPEAVCHVHNCGSCFTEWLDPATGSHLICNGW